MKIHYKITVVFCIILAIVFTGLFLHLNSTLKDYVFNRIRTALIKETLLVKTFLEGDFPGYARMKEMDALADKTGQTLRSRVTIIGLDGVVMGDSEIPASGIKDMENHINRPEVREALKDGGIGESVRFSTTLRQNMLYIATVFGKNSPEGIVRLSIGLSEINELSDYLKRTVFTSFILAFLLIALASFITAGFITRPLKEISDTARRIAGGDFRQKLLTARKDEIGDLSVAINYMTEQIEGRIEEVMAGKTRLETVLLSLFDGLMVLDTRGRIVLMNDSLKKMLMIKEDPVGEKPLEVLRNVVVQEVADKVLSMDPGKVYDEISIIIPDEKTLRIHAVPVIRNGQSDGAVLVFRDITEQRRLEKVRKDFVANVSHELRTPASSIKGYAETLLDGAINDKENAEEFLRIIQSDSDRLVNLIDDLLDLSKIESGKIRMELSVIPLFELVDLTVREISGIARSRNIDVTNSVEHDRFFVHADRTLISQVLLNLLDNAVKYTGTGGAVNVTAEEDDEFVRISVSDNGVGIPEKDIPRIFERFYRVDKARSRELGGTGLGLSIVKHIVREHGGEVFVKSIEGKGSVFSFTVKRAG